MFSFRSYKDRFGGAVPESSRMQTSNLRKTNVQVNKIPQANLDNASSAKTLEELLARVDGNNPIEVTLMTLCLDYVGYLARYKVDYMYLSRISKHANVLQIILSSRDP